MARRGAVCAALTALWMSAATSLCPAAAADIARMPAAPRLAKEISLLARVVQAEASNQPTAGMRAVAWTVVNRLRQPEIYGRTITGVLLARHQYARPKPLRPDSPAYRAALRAATMAVTGEGKDDSKGSTHFVRCDMRRKPAWTARLTPTVKIAAHCFYREKSR
jgi:spore germination cell wall hydrolase CwlJ-like protein